MCGPTLPFTPTKTYEPISVDLRKKRNFFPLYLSLSSPALPAYLLLHFLFFLLYFFFLFILFFPFFFLFFFKFCIHGSHSGPSLIRVRFYPKTIYLFSVQFILNELSSSHFPTFEILVKISSLKSLVTYHPETRKKFRLSQNSTKFDVVTRFCEMISTVKSVSSSEIYKNSGFLTEITVLPFLKKFEFSRVLHSPPRPLNRISS